MTGQTRDDSGAPAAATPPTMSLEDLQHWTQMIGRAQQMMLEQGIDLMERAPMLPDPTGIVRAQADFWADTMKLWQRFLDPANAAPVDEPPERARDKRFKAKQWHDDPLFALIRQSYFLVADHMLKNVEAIDGVDAKQKEQIRFATRGMIDALSPTNFAVTNPLVVEKIVETRGENLLKGLQNMLADMARGQMTQSDTSAFQLGRNLAMTPGKVIRRTPLYELIQYSPVTETVGSIPLVIFPPWINRFYILDLTPEKSFIRWAVEQGLTVFVASWRSADATMKDVTWDDYVVRGQVDAIDTIRDALGVESVHAIGYCVAGTTLAATLALLESRGEAAKVETATFFTAQVDFADAGELSLFVDDGQLDLIRQVGKDGYLDGRYMAATFNLLRGRDLIWNYVTNNYLLGNDYVPFDLLHWNADVTNLPAKWHLGYLTDLYRDNRLARPGSMTVDGVPIDLTTVKTPSYIQAGREDHIAPAESVWKITEHFAGPLRFVLAGSGHIAGVVNPPSAAKYQYWTNDHAAGSLAEFVAGATETKGSWWPDWRAWIAAADGATVAADGARIPGRGTFPALAEAPGEYVRTR